MSVTVQLGDSRVLLAALDADSVDSCVCDPPYELGFMGRAWDSTGVAYDADLWREVFRVLKPGSHLVAFGGTRTYHRMVVAIEDAGFEIRDQLAWVYGSGFPKSLDVSKAIDKAGAEAAQWQGWGTALKPAWEPICLARKPLIGTVANNVLAHGTGALNIDGCRVETDDTIIATRNIALGSSGSDVYGGADTPGVYEQKEGGRFPANLVHDGSEEVEDVFARAGERSAGNHPANRRGIGFTERAGGRNAGTAGEARSTESGSAARFFYSAKAGKLDRLGSDHPTVKPVDLMRWIERLVTPPRGLILDPFAGSGSTGIAAHIEGFDAILMELRPEAVADIERRLAHIKGEGRTTAIEAARLKSPKAARKARGGDTPLFAEPE